MVKKESKKYDRETTIVLDALDKIDLNRTKRLIKKCNKGILSADEYKELFNLLVKAGIVEESSLSPQPFRTVFRYFPDIPDWIFYAVPEICGEDNPDEVQNIREAGKWCSTIIKYIILENKMESAGGSIHLFLHDGDLVGYDDRYVTHFDGKDACKEERLIEDGLVDDLKNIEITITLFKHQSNCVWQLIKNRDVSFEERGKTIKNEISNALLDLRGIRELVRIADKRLDNREGQ